MISAADAAEEMAMMKNKELKLKKQLIDSIHVNKNGEPRTISYHGASPSYPNGYFYTRLDGRKIVKAKTEEELYVKLFTHYFKDGISKNTVQNIFDSAIKEKRETENVKEATLYRYLVDFRLYISDELARTDLTQIDHITLKRYTQNLVNSISMNKKQFLAYKGLLNLIFGYAIEHDIISTNPVLKIKNAVYLKSCDLSKPQAEDKIFSEEEITTLLDVCEQRIGSKRHGEYYVNAYAMKFAICTGVRAGELCALKWDDIDFDQRLIHIHAQQLIRKDRGKNEYYYAPYTKNERGMSSGGRYFPLTNELFSMLAELKDLQNKLGIQSEFVFCHENGAWIATTAYESFLRRLCRKCGFKITNNHAFRMSFNSNVLIQNGVAVTDRASLLGHSVATNLNYYSFAQKDYAEKVRKILDNQEKEPESAKKEPEMCMIFPNKKALKRLV